MGLLVVMHWVERLSLCQRMRLKENTDILINLAMVDRLDVLEYLFKEIIKFVPKPAVDVRGIFICCGI